MAGCRPGHGRELSIHALCVLHRSSAASAVAEGPDDSAARRATKPHRAARDRRPARTGHRGEGRRVATDGATVAIALRQTGSRGTASRRAWSWPPVVARPGAGATATRGRGPTQCGGQASEPSPGRGVSRDESIGTVASAEEDVPVTTIGGRIEVEKLICGE